MILLFLATLGIIVVGFVLYPVFAEERMGALGSSGTALTVRDLEDKKARLYTAIKDLDFEKASGKVSDEDYESARRDYLAQAAEVMARLDELAPKPKTAKKDKRASKKAGASKATASRACPSCGADVPTGERAKFCIECGHSLARACTGCEASLPDEAKFCPECGKEVSA